MAKRLLVDITAHGYGHLSQTAPVLQALRKRRKDLNFVVRSGLSPEILRRQLGNDIDIIYADTDFGCVMKTPFEVDRQATLRRYAAVNAEMDEIVSDLSDALRRFSCSGVLTNISYPALLAAREVGLRSVAFSSLIWSEVANHYIGTMGQEAQLVLSNIRRAYDSASVIFRLEPGMPMTGHETMSISDPIACKGRRRREQLRNHLGIGPKCAIVLCALGGMVPKRPRGLTSNEDAILLGPAAWSPLAYPIDDIRWEMQDLIASADLVLTKPGYGIVSELSLSGTPAIFISRGDWPEEPYLLSWLNGKCTYERVDSAAELSNESIRSILTRFGNIQHVQNIRADGSERLSDRVADYLEL